VVDQDQALSGLAEALASLARFVDAEHVTLRRVTPARLRSPLVRSLRATPTAN
jgi:hypothetical protein